MKKSKWHNGDLAHVAYGIACDAREVAQDICDRMIGHGKAVVSIRTFAMLAPNRHDWSYWVEVQVETPEFTTNPHQIHWYPNMTRAEFENEVKAYLLAVIDSVAAICW